MNVRIRCVGLPLIEHPSHSNGAHIFIRYEQGCFAVSILERLFYGALSAGASSSLADTLTPQKNE